jgi:cupin fold WbuC family metalloprotein
MHPTERVPASRIDDLFAEAQRAPRRRSHLLLHEGPADPVQRLLIAVTPGAYVRPHWHPEQWEMLVILSGRLKVLMLSEDGLVDEVNEIAPGEAAVIQIAPFVRHAAAALDPRTLVLEIKPGPFRATEFAGWAPPEGAPGAEAIVARIEKAAHGDRLGPG